MAWTCVICVRVFDLTGLLTYSKWQMNASLERKVCAQFKAEPPIKCIKCTCKNARRKFCIVRIVHSKGDTFLREGRIIVEFSCVIDKII